MSRPPSYEAYRLFNEGLDHRLRSEHEQALADFERVIKLDSTYWGAIVWAADTYAAMGDRRTADSLLQVVDPHREKLGLIDRKNMEWIEADLAGDAIERRYQSWKELAQVTPTSLVIAQLGVEAYMNGRPREAVELFESVDFEGPGLADDWGYFRGFTEAYHVIGDYSAELAEARHARSRFPVVLYLLHLEARALAALGRTEAVIALLDESEVLWRGDERDFTPGDVMRAVGLELEVHD